MANENLKLALSGYLLAFFAYGFLALRIWRQPAVAEGDSGRAPMFFLGALVASMAWAAAGFLSFIWTSELYIKLYRFLEFLHYGAWFVFLLLLMLARTDGAWFSKKLFYLSFTIFVLLAGSVLSFGVPLNAPDNDWLHCLQFLLLALPVLGLVFVEQLAFNISENSRWGVKPLCLGLACIFSFDIYVFSEGALLGVYDRDAMNIRGLVHAFVAPLFFVASQRNSQWTKKIQVSHTAVFHSAALLLAGLYLLFISGLGYYVRYFGGAWGRALQLGTLVVALTLLAAASLSGSMRAKLRVMLSKHLFSYRYDYRREWLRFTATLSTGKTPVETATLVIRGLGDMLESPGGALWSRSTTSAGELVPMAQWNMPRAVQWEPVTSEFLRNLSAPGKIIDLDEYRRHPERYGTLQLPAWLVENEQCWLIIPLNILEDLTGFVVLLRARTRIELNWEVADLLKTASRQAASFLGQMHATEALLEVRKFDAFNRMSAFVVHDLKNIVTQLSLMMKNARRLRDNLEFHEDMMMTIEHSLEKMRQLMLQLREGEKPPGRASGVALLPIVRRLAAVAEDRGRVLAVNAVDPLLYTRGHEERIERVLGHMVQNAFDATPVSGKVWVTLARVAGQVQVEIGDSGEGMSAEFVQDRLFKPFQTTKPTGMGIGAYESCQYVQELGGSIKVDTAAGQGTVITLLLPLLDTAASSDLHGAALA